MIESVARLKPSFFLESARKLKYSAAEMAMSTIAVASRHMVMALVFVKFGMEESASMPLTYHYRSRVVETEVSAEGLALSSLCDSDNDKVPTHLESCIGVEQPANEFGCDPKADKAEEQPAAERGLEELRKATNTVGEPSSEHPGGSRAYSRSPPSKRHLAQARDDGAEHGKSGRRSRPLDYILEATLLGNCRRRITVSAPPLGRGLAAKEPPSLIAELRCATTATGTIPGASNPPPATLDTLRLTNRTHLPMHTSPRI